MAKDKSIKPADLPQDEVFNKKEVYQHPQPADTGAAMDKKDPKKEKDARNQQEEEKTSKEEGLNEELSEGDAGAFEGLENHAKDE